MSGQLDMGANGITNAAGVTSTVFESTISTGTAPFKVASTTEVANLNVSRLGGVLANGYALTAHNHDASDINSGTFADARIAESNVTQHQGAIDHGSIAGLGDDDHTQYLLLQDQQWNHDLLLLGVELHLTQRF